MRKVLVCPGDRPAVGFLSQVVPLVALPVLGESLIGCWIEALAVAGVKHVLIFATDRPDVVRCAVGDGSQWGVKVEVIPELKELTDQEACTKAQALGYSEVTAPSDILNVDHLPGLADGAIFRSYRDWFHGLMAFLPRAAALGRIGWKEVRPQVWCGRWTQIATTARLQPPCWLGDHVQVGPEATIGPNAILEPRVVVDRAAEIVSSAVGPDTYVGSLTRVEHSIGWGNTLIDWSTGSCTQVPDSFLLCSLGQRYLTAPGRTAASERSGLWKRILRPWTGLLRAPERLSE